MCTVSLGERIMIDVASFLVITKSTTASYVPHSEAIIEYFQVYL